MKAAPAWTPLILGPPPSSRDPSDLHAHIACYPPSPPPPHRRPHSPIIKSPLTLLLEGVEWRGDLRMPFCTAFIIQTALLQRC